MSSQLSSPSSKKRMLIADEELRDENGDSRVCSITEMSSHKRKKKTPSPNRKRRLMSASSPKTKRKLHTMSSTEDGSSDNGTHGEASKQQSMSAIVSSCLHHSSSSEEGSNDDNEIPPSQPSFRESSFVHLKNSSKDKNKDARKTSNSSDSCTEKKIDLKKVKIKSLLEKNKCSGDSSSSSDSSSENDEDNNDEKSKHLSAGNRSSEIIQKVMNKNKNSKLSSSSSDSSSENEDNNSSLKKNLISVKNKRSLLTKKIVDKRKDSEESSSASSSENGDNDDVKSKPLSAKNTNSQFTEKVVDKSKRSKENSSSSDSSSENEDNNSNLKNNPVSMKSKSSQLTKNVVDKIKSLNESSGSSDSSSEITDHDDVKNKPVLVDRNKSLKEMSSSSDSSSENDKNNSNEKSKHLSAEKKSSALIKRIMDKNKASNESSSSSDSSSENRDKVSNLKNKLVSLKNKGSHMTKKVVDKSRNSKESSCSSDSSSENEEDNNTEKNKLVSAENRSSKLVKNILDKIQEQPCLDESKRKATDVYDFETLDEKTDKPLSKPNNGFTSKLQETSPQKSVHGNMPHSAVFRVSEADMFVSDEICEEIHFSTKLRLNHEKDDISMLAKKGIQVRTGHWHTLEEEHLIKNWNILKEKYPDCVNLLQNGSTKKSVFFQHVAKNLNRLTGRCFLMLQQLLGVNGNERVTPLIPKERVTQMTPKQKSKDISSSPVKKSPSETCGKKWTEEEDSQLIQAILHAKNIKHITESTNISGLPWNFIARSVPYRTATQCRQHFNLTLYPKIISGEKLRWTEDSFAQLRDAIIKQNVKESMQLNWGKVRQELGTHITIHTLKSKWTILTRRVENYRRLSFRELLREVNVLNLSTLNT